MEKWEESEETGSHKGNFAAKSMLQENLGAPRQSAGGVFLPHQQSCWLQVRAAESGDGDRSDELVPLHWWLVWPQAGCGQRALRQSLQQDVGSQVGMHTHSHTQRCRGARGGLLAALVARHVI